MFDEIQFEKINRLPKYLFAEINDLKMEARRRGEDIIDFSMGNPDASTPQPIIDKLCETVQKPKTHGYSASKGIDKLRLAMSNWYKRKYNVDLDPDTEVGEEFRTLSGLMSLAVGMAYVVDASGKILWREQFSRGAAPANQLEAQLDLLTSGKSVALTNGNEPDEDDEEDDDGEGTVQGISIVAAGADY